MTDEQFEAQVAQELELIENQLQTCAVNDNPFSNEASHYLLTAGGKRFRPLLVVLGASFGNADRYRMISAALAVELTHVASLYHDDVMDEADLRRGVPSANSRFGNEIAILVGDYLFALASARVAALGPVYVKLQADTFAELVQGQISETIGPQPTDDPLEHYLKVISGKTASLIRTSLVFGAMVAGLDKTTMQILGDFGHELGLVFQLSDDLIDVVSDQAGKTPGTDLREGVATLPTLLLRASQQPADQELVAKIDADLSDDEVLASVLAELRAHPVIDQAKDYIIRRSEQAREKLAPLPECPAKRALNRLCDEVVRRTS